MANKGFKGTSNGHYQSFSSSDDERDIDNMETSSAASRNGGQNEFHTVNVPRKNMTTTNNHIKKHGLGNVIRVMNQLYDVFNRLKYEGHSDINLPEIVVCGSQSSGKSSVVENITGKEFLPRGIDIQTRSPIVLHLVHSNESWVEFLHEKNRRYTDMTEVKKVIEELTLKIKMSNQVISEEPITLRIHSPDVVDLTLVDLPGLIEVPTDGQPEDLVKKIRDLVIKYIQNPNSIILAVTPATNDIADAKCIRMAREVDPEGLRTIGVLTKLDLMDDGTDASEVLSNRKIKLKLGIIGVVNRSYKETQEGKTVQEGLQKEREFLERKYPILAGRNGTPFLINRISDLLLRKISETLPEVKARIEQLIQQYSKRLILLGDVKEREEKRETCIKYLSKFCEVYKGQVDGRRRNPDTQKLCTSAKINQIFHQIFDPEFSKLSPGEELSDKEIDFAIHNSHALHSMQWSFDDAFQEFAKREITKMKPLVMQCAELVYKEMLTAIRTSSDPEATSKYPMLNNNIALVASDLINKQFEDCKRCLDDYLDAEAAIANTSKSEFLQTLEAITQRNIGKSMDNARSTAPKATATGNSEEEEHFVNNGVSSRNGFPPLTMELPNANSHRENVKELVLCYFGLTKRDVQDHIKKAIIFKLIYGVVNDLNEVMMNRLTTQETVEELMQESQTLINEREATNEMLKVYLEAKNIIDVILQTAQV